LFITYRSSFESSCGSDFPEVLLLHCSGNLLDSIIFNFRCNRFMVWRYAVWRLCRFRTVTFYL